MSTATSSADRPGAHATGAHRALAPGALGLGRVLFCIVTGAAPIAAMLFNVPITVLGGGSAAPSAFLVATIVLTIFSVGYVAMARRVTAAGGFYSFIAHGFGRTMGMGSAVLITLCYMVFTASVLGTTGYFTVTTVNDWTGISIPVWVVIFGALAISSLLAWFHIELTAAILGVFLVTELLGLIVFAGAILLQGGDSGLPLAPLNPMGLFENAQAIAVFGAAATGVALFGAFWSWVGFEMAPNYAEESRDPKRIMGAATYISVIGLGLLYVLISYCFVVGWGEGNVAGAVNRQYEGELSSAFYPLTDRFFGAPLTAVFSILIVTGCFACQLAFYNTAARYVFSMAREGLLPAALGRTHATHLSPHVASMAVTVIVGLYALAFVIADPTTEGALLKLGTWSPLLGVLGILAVQALCSFAIVRYFLTTARDGFRAWSTFVAPVLGGITQLVACYLLVVNRGLLAGAADALYVRAIPWVVLAMFAAGVVLALFWRAARRERYEAIGHFVHEDVVAEPA